MEKGSKRIGILALQGNFGQHANLIANLGMDSVLIRGSGEMRKLDGLIIPGGESTTICQLLTTQLREEIVEFAAEGKPILGTCAGLILLASSLAGDENKKPVISPLRSKKNIKIEYFLNLFSLLDVEVQRNAFGPQIHSNFRQIQIFDSKGDISLCPSVCFIRAPAITNVGLNVQILAQIEGNACAVRHQNLIGLSFHPEISNFDYFHRLAFLP